MRGENDHNSQFSSGSSSASTSGGNRSSSVDEEEILVDEDGFFRDCPLGGYTTADVVPI